MLPLAAKRARVRSALVMVGDGGDEDDGGWDDLKGEPPKRRSSEPDLFVPALVGISLGGYALVVLYDVFFGNGLCGVTIDCNGAPPGWF